MASWKGDIEIVKLLTTQGPSRANVDQQSNSEDTALHLAAQYGYCGVVEFLLEVREREREGEGERRGREREREGGRRREREREEREGEGERRGREREREGGRRREREREEREGERGRAKVKDVYYYQSCVLLCDNYQYCFSDYCNNYCRDMLIQ